MPTSEHSARAHIAEEEKQLLRSIPTALNTWKQPETTDRIEIKNARASAELN